MKHSKVIVASLFDSLDQAHSGVAHITLDGGLLRANRTLRELLGFAPHEIYVCNFSALVHPDDTPGFQTLAHDIASGARCNLHSELRLLHRDKHTIWVGLTVVVLRDTSDKPTTYLAFFEDISARKQTEAALHLEIAKNQLLFKTASDGLHILDVKGNLVQTSDSFCRMLGYTADEMLGKNVLDWDLNLPPGVDFERIVLATGSESRLMETRMRHKQGGVISVEISLVVVQVHGQPFVYVSARDITLRLHNEHLLRDREASLRALIDNLPQMVWLKDLDGRYLAVNRLLAQTAGFSRPEEMTGKTDAEIWPPELAQKYRADDIEVALTRQQKLGEELGLDNGKPYWSETYKSPILDENGNVLGTTGFAFDISDRKKQQEWLQLAAAIYQRSREAIVVTDENNLIVEVNPAFTAITGYTLAEVKGEDPKILQSGKHDKAFYTEMWNAINARGHWEGEIWDRRKNGEHYPKWSTITVLKLPDGKVYRHVAQFSDITEKKRKEDQIWQQANYDTLTGLPNRRLFRDRLEQELKKSRRSGQPLALLFIDLDRFKEVNDTLGHDAGDLLLIEAAERIQSCVREADTVARLGGDEFTVILPNSPDAKQYERIASDILGKLCAPFTPHNCACYVSASIGITRYPTDALTHDELMKQADQAMYAAKEAGRNRFRYYTASMQLHADERLSLTNDLRLALVRGELEVYYQPIISLSGSGFHKAEALLRWHHPKRGLVKPETFIPLAEESGLIVEIGEWVFQQSIACIERLRDNQGWNMQISVNKSPSQFTEHGTPNAWLDTLSHTGLPHNAIAVEITEGLLLKDSPAIRQHLETLYLHGVHISLDDFGTGYSSLSYLNKFKVNYLKIDRSFVCNLSEKMSDTALTEAIIVMAHKLGIQTIAEGVETQEQWDLLAKFGCDYAQGYWFSHPLPEKEFTQLLIAASGRPQ